MRRSWRRSGRFQARRRGAQGRSAPGGRLQLHRFSRRQTPAVAAARFASADGDSPAGGCRAGSPRPASELSRVPATAARPRPGPAGPRRRHGVHGQIDRRDGNDHRRGRLQHRAHRLSGNPDRSELLPPDRHAHLSAHRQLRNERRRRRIGARLRRRPGRQGRAGARIELSQRRLARRVPAAREHGRHRRHRHAPADAAPAQRRRAERLHRRAGARRGGHAGRGRRRDRAGAGDAEHVRAWTSPRS